MDAYEATRRVFTRIQALDPDNAAKIMGLLLIQDHSEKEMIRLAFGPENLLHSLIVNARKDLGLLPSSPATTSPFLLSRQSSSSRLLGTIPPPLSVSSPSWAPPQPFSRSNGSTVILDDLQNSNDDLISPTASPFFGGGDIMDEFHLQDQLSFLNDSAAYGASSPSPNPKQSDLFYPEECRSPNGGDGTLLPYGMGWGVNGHHRRSCSVTDLCLGSDPAGFGWRPCLYFARGYCKNGSSCRFLHGLPDESAAAGAGTGKMDAGIEQQCHELLLRSKSQRLSGTSQFMASAAAYPYSHTGSLPQSPSSKGMSFLLQQQQNDSQRAAAAAAAAAALMLGGDEAHKFMGRSRMERTDFAGMVNPSSRQIYLTFPADSTFREEDVSNYFSIYGPVHDVRIPYQQKRMFGFVTFVYPETVKIILAKGNPHFVCDSRVLVKPYKEKGKVPDKYRKQQQPSERGDFSGCSTPTGMDLRDPFDLQQLGTRMMFGNCSSPDVMLRRKMEEQQQAAELQQAIEMQTRRFVGLHLLDLKNRNLSSVPSLSHPATLTTTPAITVDSRGGGSSQDGSPLSEQSPGNGPGAALSRAAGEHEMVQQSAVNGGDKEESGGEGGSNVDSDFQESSAEHNLPDSPFASPTKSSILTGSSPSTFGEAEAALASNGGANQLMAASSLLPPTSTLDMASFKSCFFQMPRFSSSHGAVGM